MPTCSHGPANWLGTHAQAGTELETRNRNANSEQRIGRWREEGRGIALVGAMAIERGRQPRRSPLGGGPGSPPSLAASKDSVRHDPSARGTERASRQRPAAVGAMTRWSLCLIMMCCMASSAAASCGVHVPDRTRPVWARARRDWPRSGANWGETNRLGWVRAAFVLSDTLLDAASCASAVRYRDIVDTC